MLSAGQPLASVSTTSTAGATRPPVPRLALSDLERNVHQYLTQALAPATRKAYSSGQSRFLHFCSEVGLQPYPLTETLLCFFVAHLASQGLAPQTVKSYLSAIRHFHITAGHGDPFTPGAFPRLQYVVRGIKQAPRQPARPRLPITPQLLRSSSNGPELQTSLTRSCSGRHAVWVSLVS